MSLAIPRAIRHPLGMTPGEIIRERRRQLGLTQGQLAELVGRIDSSAISNIERGNVGLGHERARRFADALGIDPTTLDGVEADPRPTLQTIYDRLEEAELRTAAYIQDCDQVLREVRKAIQNLAALVDLLVERSEPRAARSRAR